jgi:hypothetical protein
MMIKAFKGGVPYNGAAFQKGSKDYIFTGYLAR